MEGLFVSCAGMITLILLLVRSKKYDFSFKMVAFMILGPGMLGYFGAVFAGKLAFGNWSGFRFYGKPLFLLLGTYITAKWHKCDNEKLLNFFVPADLGALAVMKVGCLTSGCCAGVLFEVSTGNYVRFPCQMVEFVVAILMLATVLIMEHKRLNYRGRYYCYMIMYGAFRFVFECLRQRKGKTIDFMLFELSVGHLFCIATVVVGVLMLLLVHKQERAKK